MDIYVPGPEKLIHSTRVDFGKRILPVTIHLVQYDYDIPVIAVSLYFNDTQLVLADTAEMNLRFYKVRDHTFLYNPALGCNEARNIVYFGVTEQMTILRGLFQPIVEITIGDASAGSSYIDLEIDRNPIQHDDITSSTEYQLLRTFAERAEASEQAASDFAAEALNLKSIAELEADEALAQAQAAHQSFLNATSQANTAGIHADNANQSKLAAAQSASDANESKIAAKASQDAAKASQDAAKASQDAAKQNADRAESYTNHSNIVGENGNWFIWNGVEYIDSGKPSILSNSDLIAFSDTSGNINATNVKGALTESAVKIANKANVTYVDTIAALVANGFQATNPVLNPSFEDDLADWTDYSSTAEIAINSTVILDGNKSIKFALTNNYAIRYQNLLFPEGHKIYVAISSFLESATDPASAYVTQRIGISDYDTLSTNVIRPTFTSTIGSWARTSITKTVVGTGIRITLGRGVAETAVYYFDCVVAIDKTALFGAGSEPTDAEMDEFLSRYLHSYFSGTKTLYDINDFYSYVDGKVAESSANYWKGKVLNVIGDSITATGAGTTNFADVVAASLGMTANNYGINGSEIAVIEATPSVRDPIVTRYVDMTDTADLVIVAGGTNDWQYDLCPFGVFTDRTNYTFYGALHSLCVGLLEKYVGKIVMFMTPIKRMQDPLLTQESINENSEKTLYEYCNAIKEVCAYYGIPVLDMNRECSLDPHIPSQFTLYFDSYGTHPNAAGHAIMAKRLEGFIKSLA